MVIHHGFFKRFAKFGCHAQRKHFITTMATAARYVSRFWKRLQIEPHGLLCIHTEVALYSSNPMLFHIFADHI
jgi:hypothetical protein